MVQSLDMISPFLSSEFYKNKTVIVTGGAGFVGSHLCEQLLKLDAKVVAVDNFITGNPQNIAHLKTNPNFTFIEADVIQPTEKYLSTVGNVDLILHFASPASPPKYQAKPVETYLVNSLGTHYLLQHLLAKHPQARFLFASTSEIYGDPLEHPQKESYWGNVNPNGPRSCYDEAKRLGETICGIHQRNFSLDVRIVRIFNTYGPRMSLEDKRVIPQFIYEALHNQPFSIQGDGKQTRSYCYVTDLVAGILSFAAAEGLSGETINLGNPGEYSILETAKMVAQSIHPEIKDVDSFKFSPLPIDDPVRRRPDITKAKTLLNWEPQVKFKDGLSLTASYFKSLAT